MRTTSGANAPSAVYESVEAPISHPRAVQRRWKSQSGKARSVSRKDQRLGGCEPLREPTRQAPYTNLLKLRSHTPEQYKDDGNHNQVRRGVYQGKIRGLADANHFGSQRAKRRIRIC